MSHLPTKQRNPKASHELAWFRITVIVASVGYCTGQFLLWLRP